MMATRVMPSLIPQTVNPSLNLEQFMILHEVIETTFQFHIIISAVIFQIIDMIGKLILISPTHTLYNMSCHSSTGSARNAGMH
jgi:hypothetical protein